MPRDVLDDWLCETESSFDSEIAKVEPLLKVRLAACHFATLLLCYLLLAPLLLAVHAAFSLSMAPC